jgi:dolichyl-phosphate beta-glucosyltransferase
LAVRLLGLASMPDTQCGLKVFRADVVRPLFEPLAVERFAFDVEVLARAQRLDLKVREVPIHWEHREASRVSPLRDGSRMLRDILRVRRVLGPRPKAR